MNRLIDWLESRLGERPWWMNALMVMCAFMAFVYVPWDFLFKPVAEDQEAWFGMLLHGWAAKFTEPLHFFIYAAGAYGFWRRRPWMWPWAAAYSASVTVGMFLWPVAYIGGIGGILLGLLSLLPFGAITLALWESADHFARPQLRLRERYGDWALITGASSGIGAEFARALAREGINCALSARRTERLEALAAELEQTWNVETRVITADLTTRRGPDQIAKAVKDLAVGILVNNAGFGMAGRFSKQDPARLRQMIDVNCTAPVALTSLLVPAMIERKRGAIIIVGSVAGRQALPLFSVYSASKGFDLLFGESLAVELLDDNIDVTVLQPGPVATEFEQVAGEQRSDARADEAPEESVAYALEALGNRLSVVSGGWYNWFRANVNRLLPRSVLAFLAQDVAEKQTPAEMR